MTSTLTHLECGACGSKYDADVLHNLSSCCAKPLMARYDLAAVKLKKEDLMHGRPDLWRYAEVLPIRDEQYAIKLGEGWTPLLDTPKLAKEMGIGRLSIKDESFNPTGSFKARGLGVCVSRAWELGAKVLAIPSAGNAAGAAAAYGAAAGLPVHVCMPADTSMPFRVECEQLGAHVDLIDGLINDCGKKIAAACKDHGWFDLSTLKEPYRLEGKKTLGYELAEQTCFQLPDVIVYPTGGGTGLVGMWKAFDEMEELGWIGKKRPRLVSVQAEGCAPIVRAFENGDDAAEMWEGAETCALGLRVPVAVGDFLILKAIRETDGCAIAISEDDLKSYALIMGKASGIFPCPEGAACLSAAKQLRDKNWINPDDHVVVFNTGTALKYASIWE
ncbi:MAG: threonine synthase [Planctomycetota bacterium]|jgi:threonine synthase